MITWVCNFSWIGCLHLRPSLVSLFKITKGPPLSPWTDLVKWGMKGFPRIRLCQSTKPGRHQPDYFCPMRRFLSAQCQLEKIDYLNFSLFNKISFPHCQEMFAQDKKLTIVFYRFWRQKTFPYNPPLRRHWWDNSMNIKQNQRLFWSPDEALEQFVRGWLSEPRRSPSRNRHSFWHQLTDLFFVISFSWWNSKYFNSMGTQWLPIPRSSLPLTLADGGVVDCLTIVGF